MKFASYITAFLTLTLLTTITPLLRVAVAGHEADAHFDHMIVIGEAEHVMIREAGFSLKARIDTGATTSSLGVDSHQVFERDGHDYVHFSLKHPFTGEVVSLHKPLERIVKIKRHGTESQQRPVVKLTISLAGIEMDREFSLADRSRFTYPLLIGRNVLSGIYLVDVNKRFSFDYLGVKEE